MKVEQTGMILTKKVDIEFLKALEPQYFRDYIKFVVNLETQLCAVGMEIHADCVYLLDGDITKLLGGNIFYDGHVEYESTLNNKRNLQIQKYGKTPRVTVDEGIIAEINQVLCKWVTI
ncbi:MAG: DUF5674 family protein [Lachnospiraceae bacterium]|jgi:hypothetical protein|nr:DUF5674 family protein [Lachnospiraceae bacterium]